MTHDDQGFVSSLVFLTFRTWWCRISHWGTFVRDPQPLPVTWWVRHRFFWWFLVVVTSVFSWGDSVQWRFSLCCPDRWMSPSLRHTHWPSPWNLRLKILEFLFLFELFLQSLPSLCSCLGVFRHVFEKISCSFWDFVPTIVFLLRFLSLTFQSSTYVFDQGLNRAVEVEVYGLSMQSHVRHRSSTYPHRPGLFVDLRFLPLHRVWHSNVALLYG